MRLLTAPLFGVIVVAAAAGQAGNSIPKRFGIDADLDTFPQASAKEALGSVLKGIEQKRIAYVLAHLADPKFVDERVKTHGGDFDALVRETSTKLTEDPSSVKDLSRFLAEGEWQDSGDTASVTHKEVKKRAAFFRKIGNRWFLENRMKAE